MGKKTTKFIFFICVAFISFFFIKDIYFLRPIIFHSTIKKEIRSLMETTKKDTIEIDLQNMFSKSVDSLVLAGEFFTMDSCVLNKISGLCDYHFYSPQDDEYMLILFSGGTIIYDELFHKSDYTFIAPLNQPILSTILLVKKNN